MGFVVDVELGQVFIRRAGFNRRAVHVGFVVDVVELGQVFIRRAGFNRRAVHVGFVMDRVEL